jgi:membrane dipeptidase
MKNQNLTRRKFIETFTLAGITLTFNPFTSWAENNTDKKVRQIVAKIIGIDTHNHMDMPFKTDDFKSGNYNLEAEMKISGLTAICMTFSVDRPKLNNEGEAYERFLTNLNEMDDVLKANNLTRALNYADLKNAKKQKKQIVIQSAEGGHFIEGKIERIQIGYDRGLRVLGLMHDAQSLPAIGDIYTDEPKYGGLTQLGIDIIKECNRLGILIDLTHCNNEAIKKALETSTQPMFISHTGLNTQVGTNEKMAKMMMPRLISTEQAKIFADAGGVIGVWTHLADTPNDYVKNIKAMTDIVGIEHVCIGTDTKIAPSTNSNRPEKRTNQYWENTNNGFLYLVVGEMLKEGFTEKEIAQICGGNMCRIFDKVTTK